MQIVRIMSRQAIHLVNAGGWSSAQDLFECERDVHPECVGDWKSRFMNLAMRRRTSVHKVATRALRRRIGTQETHIQVDSPLIYIMAL